jgi:hypothetical protein
VRRLLAVAIAACASLVWAVPGSPGTPKDNLSLHDKAGIIELITRRTGCAECDDESSYVWRFASDVGTRGGAEVAYVSVAYTTRLGFAGAPSNLDKRVSYLVGYGWMDFRWQIKARSLGRPHVYKCSANVIVNTDSRKAKQLRLIERIAQCR